jgi:hypothetical protein
MATRTRQPMAAFPFTVWTDLATRTGEMLVASAQVIGHRTHRMAAAGHSPNLRDRREFARMGLEKVEAAGESWWAMGQQMAAMNWQVAIRAWQDLVAAGTAWMAFGSSRTLPQLMQRQLELGRTLTQSAHSTARLTDATARVVGKGLQPIHARATANAKRLRRG